MLSITPPSVYLSTEKGRSQQRREGMRMLLLGSSSFVVMQRKEQRVLWLGSREQ